MWLINLFESLSLMHSPIKISDLSLSANKKELFSNFSFSIQSGQKIAIIGNNGSGKSLLLKLLADHDSYPYEIRSGGDLLIGYVPRLVSENESCSGGERFNKALSRALSVYPDLLLLDEPTNHLDAVNRSSLFNLMKHRAITQIIVSHDPELLRLVDVIWHIHDNKVDVFNGGYDDYLAILEVNKSKLNAGISELRRAKTIQHGALMKEQSRARASREQGAKNIDNRKWPTVTSKTKATRAGTTASKNLAKLNSLRVDINKQLDEIWTPEEISYSFNLLSIRHNKPVLTIHNGSCGYLDSVFELQEINVNLFGGDRLAILGKNSSGKSTLIKAILKYEEIWIDGDWIVPAGDKVAYLDQHYSNLPSNMTVIEYVSSLCHLVTLKCERF
ncbi:MAG: ABC-F family ATP-binding cassette domain-containing protein [Neisseriaceae bacterium]|nr:MAG: ABC-F family ATP-binding cassette domain-containing protein [Neisseriaceae bacterium]